MVAEACQDTGHVYTSYSGYGDITIQSNDCDAPIGTLITITDPWSNNHTDQIMAIGTIKTFISGSEVYTVEMTDMFCGVETTWSDYTECWYTEDGNKYVKTGGLDSAIGNNWANAWKTNGYGFQNIPSGKDLYVEEGLYGGETLSNLNPPQTMKMYIQPSGHTEARCDVIIPTTIGLTNGSFETDGDWYNFYKNVIWTHGRTTEWSDAGSYSYKFYYSGSLTTGDYSKISQYIHLNNDTLTGKVRWHTMYGDTCKLSIIYSGDIIWSKIMNIGNPVPPEIESFSIDVSAYNSSYGVLDLKIECISGANSNWTCWWDNLVLTA